MRSMINEAKLTKRYNTGDYEFEEYTLGAVVDEKESGAEVLSELKAQINDAFVGKTAETKTETKTEKKSGKKDKKEEKKNATSKTSSTDDENTDDEDSSNEDDSVDGESNQDDETTDGEDGNDSDDSSDDAEDDGDGEEDAPASKGKSGKGGKTEEGKGGKKFKKKPQNYNRGIEQHKEIFSGVLRSVSPDWKKSDDLKAKAKKASESMEGVSFLDEAGEVLPAFKDSVKKLMALKKSK